MEYPAQLEIAPLTHAPRAAIQVPGSKSITNRALVLAALTASTDQPTILEGALQSEDTEVMINGLNLTSAYIEPNWAKSQIAVRGGGSGNKTIWGDIYCANSGTTMRFLTPVVALGVGRFRLDGLPRMRERPIHDLLHALIQLGVNARTENGDGYPPVIIEADGLRGSAVNILGNTSSQFLSGLLMAAPFAQGDITIDVAGPLVSVPYVHMTVAMMRQFGLEIVSNQQSHFHVPAPQRPTPLNKYLIEPDASAASYFFAVAAITGGTIRVKMPARSLQGDVRFLDVLQAMGNRIERTADAITVHGGPLRGIDVDMNDISDTVMTLAAVACFAEGPTTIRNVAHIRHKETDRLTALATELRRLGANVEERADGLTIMPAPLHGAVVQTYNDHRMAMSLALVGLKIPGIMIDQPACVAKTYPRFFEDLERLRQ